MKRLFFAIFFLSFFLTHAVFTTPRITYTPIKSNAHSPTWHKATKDAGKRIDKKTTITITIPLKKGDCAYKDYFDFSVDHPGITLSQWKTNQAVTQKYDPHFKERKKVFTKPLKITLDAFLGDTLPLDTIHLHMTYYLKSEKKLTKVLFPLRFNNAIHNYTKQKPLTIHTASHKTDKHTQNSLNKSIEIPKPQHITQVASVKNTLANNVSNPATSSSLSSRISNIVQTTQSPAIRILLVFILGLLLSLTPCIYPMIPITAGILQAQGSSSIARNALLSLSYTLGLATTFAFLGVLAALTGNLFGSFLGHPIVIIGFIILLLYLAGSMLGLYELYIPVFMRSKYKKTSRGSPFSAFCFGAASGTIASPCVSPGLIVVLGLVAQFGSALMGFVLLFSFGIGLSMPLLVIGSFSGSLNLLPQTGAWMLQVKRFFGFLLVGMSLYLLQPLVPFYIILWLLVVFAIVTGITHFAIITTQDSQVLRALKNGIGLCLLASSLFISFKAYQATYPQKAHQKNTWQTDYFAALAQAQKEHKKLLVDIGAPFCSLCTTIDKRIFCNTNVQECLKNCITVKIDGSNRSDKCCKTLKEKYNVVGFPTVLLIDPHKKTVLKRWGSKLYNEPIQHFTNEIKQLITH